MSLRLYSKDKSRCGSGNEKGLERMVVGMVEGEIGIVPKLIRKGLVSSLSSG